MNDYILFMHDDAPASSVPTDDEWAVYLSRLRVSGAFEGGSAIGGGHCVSKGDGTAAVSRQLVGYIRVRAENWAAAEALVVGNPTYEAGGTVEIRELPKDD